MPFRSSALKLHAKLCHGKLSLCDQHLRALRSMCDGVVLCCSGRHVLRSPVAISMVPAHPAESGSLDAKMRVAKGCVVLGIYNVIV